MANNLKSEKKIAVVSMLCEGSSIRSVERITGVKLNTISGEKISLAAVLKREVKEISPELKFEIVEGDQIVFKKPVTSEAELWIQFEKSLPRLGKAFTIFLGIDNSARSIRYQTNIFQLERSREEKSWIFGGEIAADLVVKEALTLIKGALPKFELSLKSYFDPWPIELPKKIEQYGNVTARQAFDVALALARNQFPDARLARLADHVRSLRARDIAGTDASFDGRLSKNSEWWFHFYSPRQETSFEITVPAIGRAKILGHGSQYKEEHSQRYLTPIGESWMDSDRAFAIAEERGGRESRNVGETFGISTKLCLTPSGRRYWGIMYMQTDDRGRKDFIIHIDAETGETLTDIRGF